MNTKANPFKKYPLTDARAAMARNWEAKQYCKLAKIEAHKRAVPMERCWQANQIWFDAMINVDAVCR